MGRAKSAPHGDAAMTFEEIGREMGISRGGAWMLYKTAIRKLKRKKLALQTLREIASAKG